MKLSARNACEALAFIELNKSENNEKRGYNGKQHRNKSCGNQYYR